jgi:hypothetical protein
VFRARKDITNLLEGYVKERMPKKQYKQLLKENTFKQIAVLQDYLRNADTPFMSSLVGKGQPKKIADILQPPPKPPVGKPPEVTNPTDPFYNVKRVGVNPEQQNTVKQVVEEVKPQIEQVVGKKLSHQEVIDFAHKTSQTLNCASHYMICRTMTDELMACLVIS